MEEAGITTWLTTHWTLLVSVSSAIAAWFGRHRLYSLWATFDRLTHPWKTIGALRNDLEICEASKNHAARALQEITAQAELIKKARDLGLMTVSSPSPIEHSPSPANSARSRSRRASATRSRSASPRESRGGE